MNDSVWPPCYTVCFCHTATSRGTDYQLPANENEYKFVLYKYSFKKLIPLVIEDLSHMTMCYGAHRHRAVKFPPREGLTPKAKMQAGELEVGVISRNISHEKKEFSSSYPE